jgi:hypothetical protein
VDCCSVKWNNYDEAATVRLRPLSWRYPRVTRKKTSIISMYVVPLPRLELCLSSKPDTLSCANLEYYVSVCMCRLHEYESCPRD